MSSLKSFNILILLIIVGILASTLGVVGAHAVPFKMVEVSEAVSGSGSAGSGSLAVAAFFSVSNLNGAGAFSGDLHSDRGYSAGLFQLTVANPPNAPLLPCPAGQVSAGGTVVSGSLLGANVRVASCIGSGVPGAFVIYHACFPCAISPDYYGQGTGAATLSSSSLRSGIVAASATSGSGTAGPGTIYTAEADAVTKDGSLVGGGAFVGTISDQPSGNIWNSLNAVVQPGCTLTTSGVTASFGSFPNQPVTSSYTPLTCPPTSLGPQDAVSLWAIHSEDYVGAGTARIDPYKNF